MSRTVVLLVLHPNYESGLLYGSCTVGYLDHEEQKLSVLENSVLRRIFASRERR
jgi:hypothetical protein